MSRLSPKGLFLFGIFMSLFITFFNGCLTPSKINKPNVIIILTDDQGWGDLGIHGNSVLSTPHLDRLAERSIQFERFYVSPLCAPTRASLLSGRYHLRTGTTWVTHRKEVMDSDEITIAEILKENNYSTALFGKWHNGHQYPNNPQGQGFDHFYGFSAGHWNNYFNTQLELNGTTVTCRGYLIDDLTQKAMDWMGAQNEPFFCLMSYNTPHSPFQVSDTYFNKYKEMGLDDKNAAVYGMCENIDDNVGEILDWLESTEQEKNTIVIFLTDNGPNGNDRYNGNMRGAKGSVYEGGVRVPLFIQWEEHLNPKTITTPSSHIDILPTLMGLCDIQLPPDLNLDGTDLSNQLLDDSQDNPDREILTFPGHFKNSPFPGSIRNSQFAVVMLDDDKFELYDLINDPSQTTDIAKTKGDLLTKMSSRYMKIYGEIVRERDLSEVPPIPVGHTASLSTFLPAPEAQLTNGVEFKGGYGWANDWIINWDNGAEASWKLDNITSSNYEAVLHYNSSIESKGPLLLALTPQSGNSISFAISEAFWPPYIASPDRVKRGEVYEKKWNQKSIGTFRLPSGDINLRLTGVQINTGDTLEVKGLTLTRINDFTE